MFSVLKIYFRHGFPFVKIVPMSYIKIIEKSAH